MDRARDLPAAQRQTPAQQARLFQGAGQSLLERHPYTAQQILQQLRQQGYAGGYTILKEFVRQVRPVRKPAFLMLDFAREMRPGRLGRYGSVQVGSTRRRLSFFVMVLCYSRMMYLEFTCPRPWSSSWLATAMPSSFFRVFRPGLTSTTSRSEG